MFSQIKKLIIFSVAFFYVLLFVIISVNSHVDRNSNDGAANVHNSLTVPPISGEESLEAVDPPAENAWPNLGHGNGASTYSAPLPPAAVVSPGRERHSLDNPRRTMPRDAGRREIGGPAGGATTARNGAEGEGGAVQVVPQLVQQTQDEQTQDHLVPTLSLHRHQQQDQVVPGRRQFTTVEQHQQQDDQIVPLR